MCFLFLYQIVGHFRTQKPSLLICHISSCVLTPVDIPHLRTPDREESSLTVKFHLSLLSSKYNTAVSPAILQQVQLQSSPSSLPPQAVGHVDLLLHPSPLILLSQPLTLAGIPWELTDHVAVETKWLEKQVGELQISTILPSFLSNPQCNPQLIYCCGLSSISDPIPRLLSKSWWDTLFSSLLRIPSAQALILSLFLSISPQHLKTHFYQETPGATPSSIPKELSIRQLAATTLS